MDENYLFSILIFFVGIIITTILLLILQRASNRVLSMFALYAESQDILKISLRLISYFFSIIVFLVFLRLALKQIGLLFTINVIENVILHSGKYFTAFLIIIGGFYLSKKINTKIKASDKATKFGYYFYFLSHTLVNTAFILTGLLIVGVDISVFLTVYKVILLTIGITLALIVGIPLGVYFSNRFNGKKRK